MRLINAVWCGGEPKGWFGTATPTCGFEFKLMKVEIHGLADQDARLVARLSAPCAGGREGEGERLRRRNTSS